MVYPFTSRGLAHFSAYFALRFAHVLAAEKCACPLGEARLWLVPFFRFWWCFTLFEFFLQMRKLGGRHPRCLSVGVFAIAHEFSPKSSAGHQTVARGLGRGPQRRKMTKPECPRKHKFPNNPMPFTILRESIRVVLGHWHLKFPCSLIFGPWSFPSHCLTPPGLAALAPTRGFLLHHTRVCPFRPTF